MWWLFVLLAISTMIVCFVMLQAFQQALQRREQNFSGIARENLAEVFLFIDPAHLWSTALLSGALFGLLVWLLSSSSLLGASVGVAISSLPPWGVKWLKQRRRQRFEQQLPDTLRAFSGALRTGASIQTALKNVTSELSGPVAQEFLLILHEQRLGLPLAQALEHLQQRMPLESTQLLVSSLKIALQTGGNLAESLQQIADTLAAILQLQARVKALTSQGRMQAWIMAAMPVFLFLVLQALDPDNMNTLWQTYTGWAVLGVMLTLEVAGIYCIQRIVRIEV